MRLCLLDKYVEDLIWNLYYEIIYTQVCSEILEKGQEDLYVVGPPLFVHCSGNTIIRKKNTNGKAHLSTNIINYFNRLKNDW